ncbi:hypothetical protein [Maricaulis salignorans]|uniref:Secreted protein n=1 Tax=Maricaulis salignorans TaxID=144026 RepID=A0A1G9PTH3_9PROT|nr:hypothetical protein [Maricaulis salignorans]SDM01943.1 hypothetical protein SAMN04488568_10422 [Maricaulis salignorans]
MLRKTVLAAAAVAMLGAVSISAALAGGPGTFYEYTYYSDATLTEDVGYASEYCHGSQVLMGQAVGTITPYYTRFPLGNCSGGPD